jgi:hypothetical protein
LLKKELDLPGAQDKELGRWDLKSFIWAKYKTLCCKKRFLEGD